MRWHLAITTSFLLSITVSALNYKCHNDQVLVVQSFGNDTIRMHCQRLDLCGYQKLKCEYDHMQPQCGGQLNFVSHVNQKASTAPVEHTCCNLYNPRAPHVVSTHTGNDCFIYELPDGTANGKPVDPAPSDAPYAVLKNVAEIPQQLDGYSGYRLRLFLLKNKSPPTLLVKGIERRLDGYRVTICRPKCSAYTTVKDGENVNIGEDSEGSEWKAISWSSWSSSSWSSWARHAFNKASGDGRVRTRVGEGEAAEGVKNAAVDEKNPSSNININVESNGNNNNQFGSGGNGEGRLQGNSESGAGTSSGAVAGANAPGTINVHIHTANQTAPAVAIANAAVNINGEKAAGATATSSTTDGKAAGSGKDINGGAGNGKDVNGGSGNGKGASSGSRKGSGKNPGVEIDGDDSDLMTGGRDEHGGAGDKSGTWTDEDDENNGSEGKGSGKNAGSGSESGSGKNNGSGGSGNGKSETGSGNGKVSGSEKNGAGNGKTDGSGKNGTGNGKNNGESGSGNGKTGGSESGTNGNGKTDGSETGNGKNGDAGSGSGKKDGSGSGKESNGLAGDGNGKASGSGNIKVNVRTEGEKDKKDGSGNIKVTIKTEGEDGNGAEVPKQQEREVDPTGNGGTGSEVGTKTSPGDGDDVEVTDEEVAGNGIGTGTGNGQGQVTGPTRGERLTAVGDEDVLLTGEVATKPLRRENVGVGAAAADTGSAAVSPTGTGSSGTAATATGATGAASADSGNAVAADAVAADAAGSTGGSGRRSNCFSGETIVTTVTGTKRMDELNIGDYVLVPAAGNVLKYERVEMFYHREPETRAQFVVLFTKSGRRLSMTNRHLLPSAQCQVVQSYIDSTDGVELAMREARYAEKAVVGECVMSIDTKTGEIVADEIVRIGRQYSRGIYSPMTVEGSLIADGVLASCFSHLESHTVHKAIFDFLMMTYNFFGLSSTSPVEVQEIPSIVTLVQQLSSQVLPFK